MAKTKKPKSIIPKVDTIVREIGVHPVARAMGVQAPNVYRLISGERDPQLSTIERLLSSIGYRLEIVKVEDTRDDTRK